MTVDEGSAAEPADPGQAAPDEPATSPPRAIAVGASGSANGRIIGALGVRVIEWAAGPASAAQLVRACRPQLLVVDLDRGAQAVAAIDAVCSGAVEVPVLALGTDPEPATVLAAVRAGAVSVLRTADADLADLAAAAVRTIAGVAVFGPGLAGQALTHAACKVDQHELARTLTGREADVLRLVVDGLTARQIGVRLELSPRTVDNHVQNVLRKLDLHSRTALVRFAIETGLV